MKWFMNLAFWTGPWGSPTRITFRQNGSLGSLYSGWFRLNGLIIQLCHRWYIIAPTGGWTDTIRYGKLPGKLKNQVCFSNKMLLDNGFHLRPFYERDQRCSKRPVKQLVWNRTIKDAQQDVLIKSYHKSADCVADCWNGTIYRRRYPDITLPHKIFGEMSYFETREQSLSQRDSIWTRLITNESTNRANCEPQRRSLVPL